jgi:pyruvate dehydrogenase E2 component (dihydrolipoamide acetyltransferase)
MATEVIVPKVDMVMDEATFVEWLKDEGEQVDKGEPLFVILTDKANIEIEAPASGILAGLRAQPDDVLPVTEVIGYLLEPGENLPEFSDRAPDSPVEGRAAPSPIPPEPTAREEPPSIIGGKVRATPVARRLAREMGVDLTRLIGRGPRGRIHKADVETYAQRERQPISPALSPAATSVPLPDARKRDTVPLAGPRKIIAQRMTHSAFTAPHITLALHVDMSEAARLRSRLLEPLEERSGHRLSFTAIIARAVAAVLPQHPYLNASLRGEEIVLWEDVHLGIATSVEDYLIVPVIRQAQLLELEQLVSTLADLSARARAKRLTPAEMSGSTFTITNLGMFGIEAFTAIINPPEAAILAVGRIVDTPASVDGEIGLRPLMHLTLSADHRIVDGAAGARFLAELKATLENPYLLI